MQVVDRVEEDWFLKMAYTCPDKGIKMQAL
jgi:hypothetical protein